jgi:class 3 adenylate cyclase
VGGVPQTRYAKCGQLDIAYQDVGDGTPVVWVPGFVSHLEMHRELPYTRGYLESMERFARLITFDKRGTGLSDRSLGVGTLEDRMDDIRAVYDACGLGQAAVVAVSEGGPLAMLFAATFPDRVSHLVIYSSYTHTALSPELRAAWRARLEANWGTGVMDGLIVQHGDATSRVALARLERYSCTPSMVGEKAISDADLDVRSALGAIAAPTLVLHNVGDPFMPVSSSRAIAEAIPGARFVELAGDFHASWRPEDYDELVEHIEQFVTGTHMTRDRHDRVLTTLLFTDIVGSTDQAVALGDQRWHHLLDDHDRSVRAEFDRHRGREVNTTGDGFLAAFDGPARAIRCGLAVARWARTVGVDVRVGVHTGECEVRGDDLAGIAVHIGARVAALAGPGETLVTSTVRDLVAGSGLTFEERGAFELKGVPGSWTLLAARDQT